MPDIRLFRSLLLVAGAILILAGLAVSNRMLESFLIGSGVRTLGWGAALFRALLVFHGIVLILFGRFVRPDRAIDGSFENENGEGKFPWGILVILSLAALGLRLWRLNTDLWHDEVLTLLDFVRMPMGEILTSFPSQNQHMFFSVLAHLSVNVFGESAWALRLPSVIFGVASLWALYLLGRRIAGGAQAIAACVLMTLSYHHIWFSQNARGYMGLLFFTLLATWLWLEALDRDRWGLWIGYSVAVALGAWFHLTMAFVALTHVLLSLDKLFDQMEKGSRFTGSGAGRVRRPMVVAWLLCGSLTLQLYALAMPEFLKSGLHEVSLPSEWTNPLWVLTESLRSLKSGFSGIATVLAGGLMLGMGWLSLLRENARQALSLILPALLAGGTMLALGHNLWPRFFFFSMGFGLLIVIRGAMTLPGLIPVIPKRLTGGHLNGNIFRERTTSRIGWALVAFIIIASAITVPRNYKLPKQDFTGARDYVESVIRPGEAVVAVGLAGTDYGRYFAPHWLVASDKDELLSIRKSHPKLWVVYTLPIEVKTYHPQIWQIIEREFEIMKVFPGTLGGGEVYVCRSASNTTF